MPFTCLITGATGFVGSHLAEACVQRGHAVRALARAGSDTKQLESRGVTIVRGDLTEARVFPEALQGVQVVFHTAAKVGDWGHVADYRAVNVEALRNLLEACRSVPLQRFVHFSSLGVNAAGHHYGTTETAPLPVRHVDGYTQTKVEAEQLALGYQREHGVPVVVLRPGFVYGPRDRWVLPRLIENLHAGRLRYLGGGNRAMNTIYVGNLVEAALIAAEKPNGVGGVAGHVFNLTDGERVSKRRFIEAIADGLGLPRPKGSVPLWVARLAAWWMEGAARRRNDPHPPRLTQGRLKFLGMNLDFSIEKAKRELGYQPRYSFDQGLAETIAWYKQNAV
jgi:nucleoside-diphosphate-sugar epimerase